jgi:hypothetical protein
MGGRAAQADPNFQASRRGAVQDVQQLAAQLMGAEKQARQIGQERVSDEENIAKQSRGYVEGQKGAVDTALDAEVQKAKAYDQALESAYGRFQGSGNVEDLRGAPGVSGADIDKVMADPEFQRIQRGQQALAGLQEQFKDIGDVPFYEPGVDSQGFWTAGLDPALAAEMQKRGKTPEEVATMQARAAERQKAYAAAGFAGNLKGWDPKAIEAVGAGALGPEDYSDVKALYGFGTGQEAYQPPNLANRVLAGGEKAVDLPESQEINRGAVATPEQRYVHDRASKLLDLSDELEAAEPFEKRTIATNLIKALDEQAQELEARRGDLTAAEADYLDFVRSSRKSVRAAKRKRKWNQLSRLVTDIATAGTYEVARPVTGGGFEGTLTGMYGGGK